MADGTPPRPFAPSGENILAAASAIVATTTQTAFLTIPAGRTWTGRVVVTSLNSAAAASAQSTKVVTAGTGVLPAATTCVAMAGSLQATAPGVTAQWVTVVAPTGNAVTLELLNSTATTYAGFACASGVLLP